MKIKSFLFNIRMKLFRSLFLLLSRVKVMNAEDTVKAIKNHHLSVSRLGDGEFKVIFGTGNEFQAPDSRLAARLAEILKSSNPDVLVCIPYALRDMSHLCEKATSFWRTFVGSNFLKLTRILSKKTIYGDASFTRFYMDYQDKSDKKDFFSSIKEIWNERDVYIVEGENSCLGVGNDIFDNTKSIHRLLCPPKDAFNSYDRILEACNENIPKGALVLCALGMTATVLAYDLAMEGYQAIDIGHLDIEYEWMRMGALEKCPIPGKAVNEAGNVSDYSLEDSEYKKSIIMTIK